MTEKRFICNNKSIINTQTDELINASSEKSAEIIVDWLNEFENENEQLKEKNKELKQEIEKLSTMKTKGLKVLEFYEDKLKHADKKELENAREELWIVKEVLCEMGVIKDDD